MPVLIQALVQGAEADQILASWPAIALPYLEAAGVTKAQSVRALDGVRDRQIKSDLQSWLKLHRFYPGILEKLDELLKGDIPGLYHQHQRREIYSGPAQSERRDLSGREDYWQRSQTAKI